MSRRVATPPFLWSAVPAAVALLFFLMSAPSVSGDKDGSEFTLALATGGVPHPTGYPLYVMGGHLFVLLLRGLGATWPYAANAWSAVGAAVAVMFLHALAARLIPPAAPIGRNARAIVALLPVAVLTFNPLWGYEATLAEVYTWHVAWTLAAATYFLWLMRRLTAEEAWPQPRAFWHALAWGALCGAGGAHHATALLVAAPLSVIIFQAGRLRNRVGPKEAGWVLLGAVLPLLSYGFVAWRAFNPAQWQWPTLTADAAGIFRHVTGAAYRHFLGTYAPSDEQQALMTAYVYPYLFGALVILIASVLLARERTERWSRMGLTGSAVLLTVYAFNYGVPDPSSYFLAPLAIALAAIVPFGAELWARGGAARRVASAAGVLATVGALILVVHGIVIASARKEAFIRFDERVRGMWASIPYDRAFVVWGNDMYTRLREYQVLHGEKPQLEVINPNLFFASQVADAFASRHGFHPLEGVQATQGEALTEEAARAINRQSPLPVIIFDPVKESVRLLRKP